MLKRLTCETSKGICCALLFHSRGEAVSNIRLIRGGDRVKSKLMAVCVLLLLAVLAVPVMARPIGPGNAEKNPNIRMHDGETVLLTPGGVQNEWRDTEASVFDFFHILNASKTKLPRVTTFNFNEITALLMDPVAALKFENKWGYMSQETLLAVLILMGETEAEAIAAMWPDGMYFRYHNVGK